MFDHLLTYLLNPLRIVLFFSTIDILFSGIGFCSSIVLRCEIASPSHQSGVKYEMKV